MTTRRDVAAPREVRTLFGVGAIGDWTDGQLLERFATDRGEGEAAGLAFAAIVERHGPTVLRACRAILRDEHEAHDAFQATFLVLVKKARSLWVRDSLGPWLHQVARRAAKCARSARARRRGHERRAAEMAKAELAWADERIEGNRGEDKVTIALRRQAEIDRLRASNALRDAESRLDILTKYTTPRQAIGLDLDLEKAKGDELAKKAMLGLARDRWKTLERQIEQCVVRAPADGKVLHGNDLTKPAEARRIDIEEGATVRERQILFWVVPEREGPAKE